MSQMPSEPPPVVQACHDFLLWLVPTLDHFPRNRRFTLGERLESGLLQVLELLVEAAYHPRKAPLLTAANRKLAVLRHLWRLCHELEVISTKRYEHGARFIESIGRQVGAWRKASAA